MWNKSLSSRVEILVKDEAEGRFIAIKLKSLPKNIVIMCVYFPCLSIIADYTVNCCNILALIERTINDNAESVHIIAGDFNFEYAPGNHGFDLFSGIVDDYSLRCCDSLNKTLNYTYSHATLDQRSWLDHFFVTDSFFASVISCSTLDRGDNLSDHLPFLCF